MAWDVDEDFSDESARDSEYEETRTFVAVADNDNETVWSARLATGIPARNSPHPVNTAVVARSFRSRRRGQSTNIFEVEVGYREITAEDDQDDDPLEWAVTLRYEKIVETRPYSRALFIGTAFEQLKTDGTTFLATSPTGATAFVPPDTNDGLRIIAVQNSAAEPYEDAPEAEFVRAAMIATRNEETVDFQLINDWQNSVNTHAFYGALPGQLRLTIEPGDAAVKNGIAYRPIAYRFDFRVEGWDDYILDAGFNHIYTSGVAPHEVLERRRIKDASGGDAANPQLLDGAGQKLTPISSTVTQRTLIAAYRVYRPYTNRRNFSGLGLVFP